MTPDLTEALVRRLVAATGYWRDDEVTALADEIETWNDSQTAVETVMRLCREWPGDFHPTLPQVVRAYNDTVDLDRQRHPALGSGAPGGCGGSRWIDGEPCPRCNPYLRDIYQEPDKWDRYLEGAPLHVLHPDVKLVREHGREVMRTDQPLPPACLVESRYERYPAYHEGVEIARRAYAQECADQGREPDWAYFDAVFSSSLGAALDKLGEHNPP